MAAAFGRLCVETFSLFSIRALFGAAAFGRLCVETLAEMERNLIRERAAAFGRLCVETLAQLSQKYGVSSSRLRAAVC